MAILIYGKNPVYEALKAKRKIHEVYLMDNQEPYLMKKILTEKTPLKILTKQQMNQMFPQGHQGFGALVEDYQAITLEDAIRKEGLKTFIMLDSIEDPQNLGAIIRSAAAFQVSGIIIPKHRSADITPAVIKVSAGAIEYVDLIRVTNLNATIQTLKQNQIWVVGTDLETSNTLKEIHPDTHLCIVFGSEGKGLSPLVKKNCDYTVKIPMTSTLNSLNVSVACGIVLYDITRRR